MKKKLNKAWLLLGSNLGDRMAHLKAASAEITAHAGVISRQSHVYETEAWGDRDQPDYFNQVLEISTPLSPQELLHCIQRIEEKFGRERNVQWAARTLDIDILFYNDQIIREEGLTIPHPHLHERNFTLIPLLEIAPLKRHPVLQQTVEELYLASRDQLEVVMVEGSGS